MHDVNDLSHNGDDDLVAVDDEHAVNAAAASNTMTQTALYS